MENQNDKKLKPNERNSFKKNSKVLSNTNNSNKNKKISKSKESITSVTSIVGKNSLENSPKQPKGLSFFDQMKNVQKFASSIVSTVQDKVSKIEEVIGEPILEVTGIKEDKKFLEKKNRKKVKKKSVITWKIDKNFYELIENKRKIQIRKCLHIENYSYKKIPEQHKDSIIRINNDKPITDQTKLFNNVLDQLTDYELCEVIKKLTMKEKLKLRRVSKRFRSCINQIIQNESAFAIIEKNLTINLDLKKITSFSIDPIYVSKKEFNPSLMKSINSFMTKLNSIVLAFPLDFQTFLDSITRRNLKNLILIGQTFNNKHLNALSDYTINLNSLSLDSCEINDQGLNVIVRECGKILNLRLFHCNLITGSFLEYLPINFVSLEFNSCKNFKIENWAFLFTKERKQMINFSIEKIAYDRYLFENIEKFEKLISINVSFNVFSDYKIIKIGCLTRLEILKISDYTKQTCFTDEVFLEIQRGCDRLSKIDFDFDSSTKYLTDASFSLLSESCAKLTCIKLSNIQNLTEATLISISKLRFLLEFVLNNVNFTELSLLDNLPKFKSLQKLTITNCSTITNNFVNKVLKSSFNRNVWYHLTLKNNPNIKFEKSILLSKPNTVIINIS